jgi:very-short-patch-repair endonuclease
MKRWAALYKGTEAEHALEPAVASLGRPYRFQHPLWHLGLFPDFCLIADRTIIEVDDPSHHTKAGRLKDIERTRKLSKYGWRVVRCTNEEAVNDPYGTVNRLMEAAGLSYRASPPRPPQSGKSASRTRRSSPE